MTVQTIHRQFGSKSRVAQDILRLVPAGKRIWVEVFAGSAAVTLAKQPHPAEHINDLNGSVVNLFTVIRDPTLRDLLCEAVEFTPWSQQEMRLCEAETKHDDPVEWARRFLVASWQTIGGKQAQGTGWRIQLDKDWPMGTWRRLPDRIRRAAWRLREVYIHQRHCVELVGQFADREEAVLFLDPPYPLELTNTRVHQVYEVDMTTDEHMALASALRGAKASVILTMAHGSLYEEILQGGGWHRSELLVRGLRNSVKSELVLTNFLPPPATGVQLSWFGGDR
ncbi:MAG: DNA adenine methylase [Bacteroidota bacterium]